MPLARDIEAFFAGLGRPEVVQEHCLLELVRANQDCEYGRRYRFDEIRTIGDYQRNVPIVAYADLEPWIGRIARGEAGVLTREPVRRFFATSGSTGVAKTVPVTSRFIADKSRAFGVYWGLLFRTHPAAAAGKVVGNFSDSGGARAVPCGLPLTSEGAFWNAVGAVTQRRGRSPIPLCVSAIADSDARYYTVARILLEEDVSLLMALNPSTLLLLFRKLNLFSEDLLADLERGGLNCRVAVDAEVRQHVSEAYRGNPARARRLRELLGNAESPAAACDIWPSLRLVASWRSLMQGPYLRLLEPYLGAVPQRDYLLMASEGVIAIPVEDHSSGGVLATPIHFYEFVAEEEAESPAPTVRLASELEVGRSYVVLLSTNAGLYRYNIGDVVRVRAMMERTPVVEFLHRSGATCSLTGEKLTERQVIEAMDAATLRHDIALEGYTLHPAADGFPHYVLLVEPSDRRAADAPAGLLGAFEDELCTRNIEYRAKRRSERLGPPELWVAAPGAYDEWRRRRVAAGANDGQIKPVHLTRDAQFAANVAVRQRFTAP
jgi:GH3 auxin-responsive promoter